MRKRRKKRKHFTHLDWHTRDRLEAMRRSEHTQKEIAVVLKVDPGTISREIRMRRRKNGYYDAETAEHKARVKRSNASYKGRKIESDKKLKDYIVGELKRGRSPDEISGRMKREKLPFRAGKDAIYAWLYGVFGQRYCRYLCTRRRRSRRQRRKTKREMIPNRISLTQRPRWGEHAEGDLFVSPTRLGTVASGALVCIPSAQLLLGRMIPNRKPNTMTEAVKKIIMEAHMDDLTLDNGIENKHHDAWGLRTYFADPHSPWQKPHVENNIGLLRKWFIHKKTDLRTVSDKQLQTYLHMLNGKYRKSLGYLSAYEVALKHGIIQKIPYEKGVGEIIRSNCI